MTDLRHQIAAEAVSRETPSPLWVRAGQLFLIPAGLVAVCLALWLFIGWLLSTPEMTPGELVTAIRSEGARSRAFYAHQLAVTLQKDEKAARAPGLAREILRAYEQVARDEVVQGDELLHLKRTLINCVAPTKDPAAVPTLLSILESAPEAAVKAACMDVLGALRGPAAAGALSAYLDHSDAGLRKHAVLNLAATGEPGVAERVRPLLEDTELEVAWNAAVGLAWYLNDPAGAPLLRQMLDRTYIDRYTFGPEAADEERHAEHALQMACRAAASLNLKEFVPLLEALAAQDRSWAVRDDAARAIQEITRNHGR